ncbi:MAG: hypothetical protein R3F11_31390 [Verrucomicrobiales bacterium]
MANQIALEAKGGKLIAKSTGKDPFLTASVSAADGAASSSRCRGARRP